MTHGAGPAGHLAACGQSTAGNRDLDLVREAEDGDTALGSIHREALVQATKEGHLKRTWAATGDRNKGHFQDGQRWEGLDKRQRRN